MSTKIEVSIGFFSAQIGRKTKRFALLPPPKTPIKNLSEKKILCHRNSLATEDLIYCEFKSQKKELIIYIRDVVSDSDCQPVGDRQT